MSPPSLRIRGYNGRTRTSDPGRGFPPASVLPPGKQPVAEKIIYATKKQKAKNTSTNSLDGREVQALLLPHEGLQGLAHTSIFCNFAPKRNCNLDQGKIYNQFCKNLPEVKTQPC